jgi:hypothetical protein
MIIFYTKNQENPIIKPNQDSDNFHVCFKFSLMVIYITYLNKKL